MKQKKISLCILLLIIGVTAQAQNEITSSGDNFSGSGGNISYTIGQTNYNTYSGSNGALAQGVQQAFEISVTLGVQNNYIDLLLNVYPNPTTSFLNLKIDSNELKNLNFQLFDFNGKLIETRKIINTTEAINLENLPSAVYVLKIYDNNAIIKTYKIIKN